MNPTEIAERLAALEPVALAHKPTPIEALPRLSAALGGPNLFIKRDDMTGLAFGGNKTRQLEYVFADALRHGADCVVAGAYTQSNWCRQISAAANRLGLSAHLVLAEGRKGRTRQGNFLLFDLLGADVRIVDTDDEGLEPFLDERMAELAREGRRPYKISAFDIDTQSRAALGYVETALEIATQEAAMGLRFDAIYIGGSEMSPAGLALGAKLLGNRWPIVGIAPVHYRIKTDRAPDIAEIANAAARLIGIEADIRPDEIVNDGGYVGPGYGIVSEASRAALRQLASLEGILLDPVYSAKAFAGLIDHVARGRLAHAGSVLFIHTGGLPALFAYADDV